MDAHDGSANQTDPVARATALMPLLNEAAARIDSARELPKDVLDAMHDAGMFRLLIPRAYGGAELLPSIYIQAVEAIAGGDASAAWCMNQGSGCSMSAAYLKPEIAREVFGGERDVLAWGQGPGAKAIRAPGGWRVTGSWQFASGSRHATWLGAHCPCFTADGTLEKHADGKPWERTMLFRREFATIDDVWQVLGLRGTGSDTYTVKDFFIDDDHTLTRDWPAERREEGVLYRFAAMQIYAAGFAATALGIARSVLDSFLELAGSKTPAQSPGLLRDSTAIQAIVGYSDARLRASRSWLIDVLRQTEAAVALGGELTLDQRITIRQAATFAIHQARDTVNQIYHEAGATAIFNSNPFEHRFRDVNAVSQQIQGRRGHFETAGQYRLGLTPNLRWV